MGKAKTGSKAPIAGQGKLGAFFSQKPKPDVPAATNAEIPATQKPPPPAATSTASPEPATPAPPAVVASTSQPVATASAGGLTEEQRKRIEENRRKALERQQLKRAHAELEKRREEEPAEKKAKEDAPAQKGQEARHTEIEQLKQGKPVEPAEKKVEAEAPVQKVQEDAPASNQMAEMPAPKAKAAGKAKAKAAAKVQQQKLSEPGEQSTAAGKQKRPRGTAKAKAASAKPASGEPEVDEGGSVTSPAKKVGANSASCPEKETPEKDPLPRELGRASPMSACIDGIPARRQGIAVEPCDAKFQTFGIVPWMQYHSHYAVRLQKLRASVKAQAQSLWSSEVSPQNFLQNIIHYKGVVGELVLVGILHKEMSARPNIIEIYSKSKVVGSLPEQLEGAKPNFASDGDKLWLEDESLRVNLEVSADEAAKLATGLVAGIRGVATNEGKVRVLSICLPSIRVPPPLPSPASQSKKGTADAPLLALVSGLQFGAPGVDIAVRDRALEFLLGRCEEGQGQHLSTKIQHVVVCGGVYGADEGSRVSAAGIAEADAFFTKLAAEVPVDLVPGQKDPTNLSMPQMPLHPHLFRTAQKCCHFRSLGSPYECTLGGLRVLGHGGQPVDDLLRCTRLQTPLEALKVTLQASVLAPTAPDTLVTQPFVKDCPFVIDTAPHVLFSGGHDRVEHECQKLPDGGNGTLCVCVPSFQKMPAIVLVNLHNPMELHVQEFGGKHGPEGAANAGA